LGDRIQTVVAIFLADRRLLFEERRSDRKVYPGCLMCPSGHLEKGETPEQALIREMKEELRIGVKESVPLFSIDDIDPFSKQAFTHNFRLVRKYEGEIRGSCEANSLRWLTYAQIKEISVVSLVQVMIDRVHGMKLY
jgi:8-oxo-dGTP diphosphatase